MGALRIVLAIALVAAAAFLAWRSWPPREPVDLPPSTPAVAPPAAAPKGPMYPLPAPDEPRGVLSDAAIFAALAGLVDSPWWQRMVRPEELARRIAATVDNLPREAYAQRLSPLHPVPGAFATRGKEGERTIAPENARRYEEHVRLMERIDPAKAAALYTRFHPLLQQAYVELGYPDGYFNDRLVAVIDHLMEAPEPAAPIRVEQPKVMHEYAVEEDEARSSGHKVMVRMGPANAKRVKAWLAAFRARIVPGAAPR